jgi:hypothetical protein
MLLPRSHFISTSNFVVWQSALMLAKILLRTPSFCKLLFPLLVELSVHTSTP